jgi:hypothetical protein
MTAGPSSLAIQQEPLLRGLLQREQRHLDQLTLENASWLVRYRQRRRLRRITQALAWIETRLMGQNTFIFRHGVLTHGLGAAAVIALGWFRSMGFHSQQAMDGVVLALFLGGMVGLFVGVTEWDRSEKRLDTMLAALRAQSGRSSADR